MKTFVQSENGSNLNQISPILTCINTLNLGSVAWNESHSTYVKKVSLQELQKAEQIAPEDGFSFAVSLRDGSCLYTSVSMSDHLGYPQGVLEKQNFLNFLYPKDHITFANHLTQGLNACYSQEKKDASHLALNKFFCRISLHDSMMDGHSNCERKTLYKPFRITLEINQLIADDEMVDNPFGTLCVNATAALVPSAYNVPNEIPSTIYFSTRHTSSCHFSHVDTSAIPYLGYLPQDMIGYSIFDFYHVEDMPQLKDIYELVVKERGSSFRSKPYRFRIQNGSYVMLETEWSCFINPWSHKLEFVVGQHRVLKGPSDIDIFFPPEKVDNYLPEEIIKEGQKIEMEIKNILTEPIQVFQAKKSKRFCSKRKRDLINFVYDNFVYNDDGPNAGKQRSIAAKDDANSSDSDSVMGDISPYREVNDSSFTSETPPTVQQLCLKENIDRFFASDPKTYSDGSDESSPDRRRREEKLSSGEHSQSSSSGSGKGSGNTSASKFLQPSPSTSNNNNNQRSGSTSSKHNKKSSYVSFDSGYGKSTGKDGNDNPNTSQEGSSENRWSKTSPIGNTEQFPSCLTLTEQSLLAHNRINIKHFKQQRKTKPSLGKHSLRDNWFQQKDAAKHKKNSPLKRSALTQTTDNYLFGTDQKGHMSSGVAQPFMLPPVNGNGAIPTPFFIPVMYMGSMPWYPNAPSFWPFVPTEATQLDATAERFQFPSVSNTPAGYPQFKFPDGEMLNQANGLQNGGPSSTAATANTKCESHKTSRGKCKNPNKNAVAGDFAGSNEIQRQRMASDSAESDNALHSASSFSLTRSSSFHSADKDEDMDCEKDNPTSKMNFDKAELTPDITFRYQMNVPNLEDTLKKDRDVLKSMAQPELVNKQLLLLQAERETENDCKLNVGEGDFSLTEDNMLGLVTEDNVNDELEKREEYLLHLMCED